MTPFTYYSVCVVWVAITLPQDWFSVSASLTGFGTYWAIAYIGFHSTSGVQFKLCLLAYKAVHSLAPQYLVDFCRPVSSVDARQRLRSAARDDLVIDRTCTKFGAQSFAVAAPLEWNRLPHHIRALQSIDSFKAALKTYLFDCLWLNTYCCRYCESSTIWLTRTLAMSLLCYGTLEIVGLLLLLLLTLSRL